MTVLLGAQEGMGRPCRLLGSIALHAVHSVMYAGRGARR